MSVTLTELKSQLRITGTDEDTELGIYLAASIEYVEQYTGQRLSRVARTAYFDSFGVMELVGDSPASITVSYLDDNGDSQTLSSAVYALKVHKARPYLTLANGQSYPTTQAVDAAVTVTYTSGYDVNSLPTLLKAAVLVDAATLYEFRENETVMTLHDRGMVERLCAPHRIVKL